jgi:hypothetical protein
MVTVGFYRLNAEVQPVGNHGGAANHDRLLKHFQFPVAQLGKLRKRLVFCGLDPFFFKMDFSIASLRYNSPPITLRMAIIKEIGRFLFHDIPARIPPDGAFGVDLIPDGATREPGWEDRPIASIIP